MELLERPKPSEGLPETDLELDAAYRTLDRVLGTISSADNKALIGLTFQGAIVAGTILIADSLKHVSLLHFGLWEIALSVALLGFFVALCWSTLKLFQTISPRIVPPHSSAHVSELFYFAGIVNMGRDEFIQRMRDLQMDQVHEGVTHITFVNSVVATRKMMNLRHAFQGLGIQVVLYVLVVMISLLPHSGSGGAYGPPTPSMHATANASALIVSSLTRPLE